MSLREVKESELMQVAEMAHEIWLEYYPPIIGEEQTNYMLSRIYGHESLVKQMREKKHKFYFWDKAKTPIGFASLDLSGEESAFLAKFYLRNSHRGTGEAAAFLKALEKEVEKAGKTGMWLTVNRQNIRAINFYFNQGFKITRCEDFDIGNGFFMNDFIMEKKLPVR